MAERSITDILGTLVDRVTLLVRNESALARTEIREILSHIVEHFTVLLVGVVLVLPGLVILLQSFVAVLERAGIEEPWASLIVGGGTLVIGYVCISAGIARLKSISLVPKETIKQLQLDVAAVQEVGKSP